MSCFKHLTFLGCYDEFSEDKVTSTGAENFILSLMCTWHVVSNRWYTSYLHIITTDI